MPTGRPSKYQEHFPQLLIDYFEGEIMQGHLPFLSRFAREYAEVSEQTALTWCEKYPDFLEAYKKAKDMQKEFLIKEAIKGRIPPAVYIFTAKNMTDMSNSDRVELTGKDGGPIPILTNLDVSVNHRNQKNKPAEEED